MRHLTPIVRGPFGIQVPHRLEATPCSALNGARKRDAERTAQSLPGTVVGSNSPEPFRARENSCGEPHVVRYSAIQDGGGVPVVQKAGKPGKGAACPLHARQAN